jgi:hypothetical protein
MRGGTMSGIRAGVVLAALAAAGTVRAQPYLSVDDVRVIEGSTGNWTMSFQVKLSSYPGVPVTVDWNTVDGSAIAGQDYFTAGGTMTFTGTTPQTATVTIVGDVDNTEWSPTLQTDEVFFIDLKNELNATLLKKRATVTIVDDDRPTGVRPGLQFVSAVADGDGSGGRVRLQWRVPPATGSSGAMNEVRVRWIRGAGCTPPGISGPVTSEFSVTPNLASETQVVAHTGLQLVPHCYTLVPVYSGVPTTEPVNVMATPFDATSGPVAWTFSAGGPSPILVPPTVGTLAVYAVSNDGVVQAMARGTGGGAWPGPWNPVGLGRAANDRSPVVPLPEGQRLFVSTNTGEVHAVDGQNGSIVWSRSPRFNGSPPLTTVGGVQATAAGLFTAFGGQANGILVGTNVGSSGNTFFMLDPKTGTDRSTFSNGLLGGIEGMGSVDYPGNTVYVLTNSATGALWAFDLGSEPNPVLNPVTLPFAFPVGFSGAIPKGSPVVREGRVYLGLNNGQIAAYQLSNGQKSVLGGVNDGEVNGFVFPDRRSNHYLYLSSDTKVWGVADEGLTDPFLKLKWLLPIPSPSIVLQWTGTDYLYVGGGDGKLYQFTNITTPSPSVTFVQLDASNVQIGAPSLDGTHNLVLVGSMSGVVYAVHVPF